MVKWPFIRGVLERCSIWQEVGGKYPVMRPCRKTRSSSVDGVTNIYIYTHMHGSARTMP
uniref:Uncharacterized protein n=1 Tax=Anguilla anguilla TaxID=7936 RepID=A0A0E9UB48_ANGAN